VLLPAVGIGLWDAGEFIEETAAFPNGQHDDQVDAASQALAEMLLDGTGFQAWLAWIKRKAEEAAAERGDGPPPEARPAPDQRVAETTAAEAAAAEPPVPLDPAAARKAARDAAFRAARGY
jgi:hypothetical protein